MTLPYPKDKILFLDIETVSEQPEYRRLSERWRNLWAKKSRYYLRHIDTPKDDDYDRSYREKAAIFAEFGKVVCISVGFLKTFSDREELRVKSFCSDNEKEVLEEFAELITSHYNDPREIALCGHNIKEFDLPYLCRRMTKYGIDLPDALQLQGKKSWEVKHLLDTMDLWKFGDYKHYTSLDLLSALFDIPSPKEDIDGSMVGKTYHVEKDLRRISRYCARDVTTTVQVFLRIHGENILDKDSIRYVDEEE